MAERKMVKEKYSVRKFIFQTDPAALVAFFFTPFLLVYLVGSFSSHIKLGLLLISFLLEFLWFWQINKAVSDLTGENKGLDKLAYSFILIEFLNNIVWMVCAMEYDTMVEYVHYENVMFIRMLSLKLKLLFSLIVTVLMTLRVKKVLTERTGWFMFTELLLLVIAVFNITPLIREELREKNYL